MGALVRTLVGNVLSDIFNLWGQTTDLYDQALFNLKDLVLRDKEENTINVSDPLTASQRLSGQVLSFIMTVHLD